MDVCVGNMACTWVIVSPVCVETPVNGYPVDSPTLFLYASGGHPYGLQVTSIQLTADVFAKGPHAGSFAFLCGTTKCDMFYVRYLAKDNKMVAELEQTNHNEPIVDIAFPQGYGALFATASGDNIRVWHATEYRELLRIQVRFVACRVGMQKWAVGVF